MSCVLYDWKHWVITVSSSPFVMQSTPHLNPCRLNCLIELWVVMSRGDGEDEQVVVVECLWGGGQLEERRESVSPHLSCPAHRHGLRHSQDQTHLRQEEGQQHRGGRGQAGHQPEETVAGGAPDRGQSQSRGELDTLPQIVNLGIGGDFQSRGFRQFYFHFQPQSGISLILMIVNFQKLQICKYKLSSLLMVFTINNKIIQ